MKAFTRTSISLIDEKMKTIKLIVLRKTPVEIDLAMS
jgi:hypothetical protein